MTQPLSRLQGMIDATQGLRAWKSWPPAPFWGDRLAVAGKATSTGRPSARIAIQTRRELAAHCHVCLNHRET